MGGLSPYSMRGFLVIECGLLQHVQCVKYQFAKTPQTPKKPDQSTI